MKKVFSVFLLSFSLFANNFENNLIKNWQDTNKNLEVLSLKITPKISDECVILSYPRLAKQGFFRADCAGKNTQFSFKLEALSRVFKLKRNILKGEVAGFLDIQSSKIDFTKAPFNAIKDINQELRFKSNVKAGKIITQAMLMPNYLINKNDSVVGVVSDGDLSIYIDLIALQSGVKGQKIRLKNPQGKNLFGEILNEKQVLIR